MADCNYFQNRGIVVAEEANWRREHAAHVDQAGFTEEPSTLHPSGRMYWLICPCKARLLFTKPPEAPHDRRRS